MALTQTTDLFGVALSLTLIHSSFHEATVMETYRTVRRKRIGRHAGNGRIDSDEHAVEFHHHPGTEPDCAPCELEQLGIHFVERVRPRSL